MHYMEMSGQLHMPAIFTIEEAAPYTHWIGRDGSRREISVMPTMN
jgi:hypothetical protein